MIEEDYYKDKCNFGDSLMKKIITEFKKISFI